MIKQQNKLGILSMIAGAGIIVLALAINTGDFNDGLLSGLGAALFAIGIVRFVKLRRLEKDPERAADYEAAFKDERAAAIGGKAGRYALFITAYAEIAVGMIGAFAFNNEVLCQALCYAACFSCLLYYGLFVYFNKKM